MTTRQLSIVHACLFGAISFAAITNAADACSRILVRGDGNLVNMVMHVDCATTLSSFWLPMSDLDFKPGAPVRRLTIAGGRSFAGNASGNFENAKAFAFLTTSP